MSICTILSVDFLALINLLQCQNWTHKTRVSHKSDITYSLVW